MRVAVLVKPRAKRNAVLQRDGAYVVHTTAAPVDGKANAAVVALLAERFRVPKSAFRIVRGHGSQKKLVEIGR